MQVISGSMREEGIYGLAAGAFTLDNHGNASGLWIPDNTGRVFVEADSLRARVP